MTTGEVGATAGRKDDGKVEKSEMESHRRSAGARDQDCDLYNSG